SEGPYTAMAYRVGEVTQNSAIIWSRLTARFLRDDDGRKGPDVIGLAGKKDNSLPETFLDPDGLHGNVPGMAGEMRVAYIEADKMDDPGVLKSAQRTPWVGVNVSTDYAHNFPLTGLKPGTKYFLKVEARRQGADQLSNATSAGSFTTPAAADQWQDVL